MVFLVYFGFCLPIVVGTTLRAKSYTAVGLTLWCSIPLVVMTLVALLVIYVRERISDTIQVLRGELEVTESLAGEVIEGPP